jgi:hypothetical protein
MKIVTPVKWNTSFVVQGSQGSIVNYVKSTRTQSGTTITDTARVCGIEVPDYQATATFGAEKYGIRFASESFDAPSMPTFTLTGTLTGTAVGATFSAPPSAAIIGATMANPVTDPWPANGAALTAVDSDGDGKPGVAADAASDAGQKNPPVTPTRTVRANRVYAAFRQVLTAKGTVKSCNRTEGTADVTQINSHVLGCRREDGTDCDPSQFKLLDSAAPVYMPTGPATITMVKLPDGAPSTCKDIKALNFDSIQ